MLMVADGTESPYRCVRVYPDLRLVSDADGWGYWHEAGTPDPIDAATRGCLLALLREATGLPGAGVYREGEGRWEADRGDGREWCSRPDRQPGCCYGGPCQRPVLGETEAEALVVALESTAEVGT